MLLHLPYSVGFLNCTVGCVCVCVCVYVCVCVCSRPANFMPAAFQRIEHNT